jgi:UDP:flavonoid glycosyltransferase YjiC (YdhE family)
LFSDRGMGRDLLDAVRARPADLVVIDALLMGALDAAARAGLRYVPLEHLFDGYQRGGWLHGPVGTWGRLHRLRPVERWNGAELALAATLPGLDPGSLGAHPENLRFVGPVVEVPSRRAGFAEPMVLVSLSTFHYAGMQRVLQKVVSATEQLDCRVVVTTGPVIDPGEIKAHARAEVLRYVPHGELMPDASLVVGHGGHATTMRALAHDLPLLVLPLHPLLDQPLVGKAVARAGAGRTLRRGASVDRIATALRGLVEDGPHRAAAARLGAQVRDCRGTATAADLLEELLVRTSRSAGPGATADPR